MIQFEMLMKFIVFLAALTVAAPIAGWIYSRFKVDPGPPVTGTGDGGASEAYAAKVDAEQGARAARRADWTDATDAGGADGD